MGMGALADSRSAGMQQHQQQQGQQRQQRQQQQQEDQHGDDAGGPACPFGV